MGRGIARRTPIVRTLAGIVSPVTRDTAVRNELSKKQTALSDLKEYFDDYGKAYLSGEYPTISTKPRSAEGQEALEAAGIGDLGTLNGGDDSAPYPGMTQPPPTNPLYWEFMGQLHQRLMTDTQGDLKGFMTLLGKRSDLLAYSRSLQDVNAGNFNRWKQIVEEDPKVQEIIGMMSPEDMNDPTRALNYIRGELNLIEREILQTVKAVEEDMSNSIGRPIKLEDLDPYKVPEGMAPEPW